GLGAAAPLAERTTRAARRAGTKSQVLATEQITGAGRGRSSGGRPRTGAFLVAVTRRAAGSSKGLQATRKATMMRVFVAGATGAIGRRLVWQLVERDHEVVATTSRPEQADALRALGATPVILDGLDGVAVGEAVASAEPVAIVHQMTALAGRPDLRRFDRWFAG
ncbi:MAG: NAD(P)H-binding protein, partial [Pseudonocardiaceae bacterium]